MLPRHLPKDQSETSGRYSMDSVAYNSRLICGGGPRSKSGGVFQIDDVTRTMSKGGGCAWCSTHPSSDPPGWLAGYGPASGRYSMDSVAYNSRLIGGGD